MAKVCEICGKKTEVGNLVSHAHNKTKTKNYPNLQYKKLMYKGELKKVRICTKCLKRIDKDGTYKGYSYLTPTLGQS